jgi:hypothetical protein
MHGDANELRANIAALEKDCTDDDFPGYTEDELNSCFLTFLPPAARAQHRHAWRQASAVASGRAAASAVPQTHLIVAPSPSDVVFLSHFQQPGVRVQLYDSDVFTTMRMLGHYATFRAAVAKAFGWHLSSYDGFKLYYFTAEDENGPVLASRRKLDQEDEKGSQAMWDKFRTIHWKKTISLHAYKNSDPLDNRSPLRDRMPAKYADLNVRTKSPAAAAGTSESPSSGSGSGGLTTMTQKALARDGDPCCVFCGEQHYLQGAHIIPHSDRHVQELPPHLLPYVSHSVNIVALCYGCHVAFDKAHLWIRVDESVPLQEQQLRIEVQDRAAEYIKARFAGPSPRYVRIPADAALRRQFPCWPGLYDLWGWRLKWSQVQYEKQCKQAVEAEQRQRIFDANGGKCTQTETDATTSAKCQRRGNKHCVFLLCKACCTKRRAAAPAGAGCAAHCDCGSAACDLDSA